MKETQPPDLGRRRVRQLRAAANVHRSVAARVEAFSALLLGAPYAAHGLTGSADVPEAFTAAVDRFDCVTYVETVLSLARASTVDGFLDELRQLRYDGGRVEWKRRNHYMTSWISRNAARADVLRPLSDASAAVLKERRLDAVPGLPARQARFSCVPKGKLKRLELFLRTGDLVFFVSTRADLDVFHCGLLVRSEGQWKLRHASRSNGKVVEEELARFLAANRMSGVVAVRPLERAAAPRGGRA